ncbi:ABC transporter permease [Natrarchaeobius chitinivorans]|uniref:ABC transporter permease n=1 Tax=Natrarchaeobius chitinivorans TaxID=1679083 RepID=A0A3N6M023_NATCH|nr:ABC transporter permease [Natrarchaeobius chitinivorans]RQG94877.1 ABC transporter permease [Natrarchaeobius chitinivorans]
MSVGTERDRLTDNLQLIPFVEHRHVTLLHELLRQNTARLSLGFLGIVIALAIFAPLVAPYDPADPNYANTFASPSLQHPFGTDSFGRDILTRIIYGARISLFVGLSVIILAMTVGISIGLTAGFYSKTPIETVLMRFIDALLAFPGIILALVIMSVLGPSLRNVIIAISIAQVPGFARLAHGTVLSIKEEEYIMSARAAGSSNFKIIRRYLLPNAAPTLIVQATIVFAFAILDEAALSFLGVGSQPPTPSFGLMILEGQQYLGDSFWLAFFPGVAIMLTVLSLNFLGDALRDVLDPKYDSD